MPTNEDICSSVIITWSVCYSVCTKVADRDLYDVEVAEVDTTRKQLKIYFVGFSHEYDQKRDYRHRDEVEVTIFADIHVA